MNNNEIIDGVFQFFGDDNQNEIDLMNKIFEGVDFNDPESLMSVTPKVLELPFNEQIHFIMAVLSEHYLLRDTKKNDNLSDFLAQSVFNDQRVIIYTLVCHNVDYSKLSKFETKHNIKIVDLSRN